MKKSIFIINLLSLLIVVIIIEIINFPNHSKSKTISQSYGTSKIINIDLDNDSKDDFLYISSLNDNYIIQIKNNFGSFYLYPDRDISTLGNVNSHWPLHVTLRDISGDSIPEIFIQSSYKNTSLINIYKWCGNNYKRLYTGTENILGFLENSTSKMPYLIIGNYVNETVSIKNFLSLNDSLIEYNSPRVTNLLQRTELTNIISNINTNTHLNSENCQTVTAYAPILNSSLKFQDSLFEFKADEFKISPINWSLNYRTYETVDSPHIGNIIINSDQKFSFNP